MAHKYYYCLFNLEFEPERLQVNLIWRRFLSFWNGELPSGLTQVIYNSHKYYYLDKFKKRGNPDD
jgi:hypothetical protein